MKKITLGLVLFVFISVAQAASHEHPMNHNTSSDDMSSHDMRAQGTGVVKAIKHGKVQITHNPIASLQWPAMTMWFELRAEGDAVKVGQDVRFSLESDDGRKWFITRIEVVQK
ncbi:MAG: copper-binding protein [Gallionella sp.]|jgi:Cu/Ag efflux protein CusF|nr:copper-binding protein [Gallionella sp.]